VIAGISAVPKRNRNLNTLLIIIPILVAYLFWSVLENLLGFDSESNILFTIIVNCIIAGTALLLLMGKSVEKIASGLMRFFVCLLIAAGVIILGILSSGVGKGEYTFTLIPFSGLSLLSLIAASAIMGWRSRKVYSKVSFAVKLGLWYLAANIVSITITMSLFAFFSTYFHWVMIIVTVLGGLIVGIISYILLLPFIILTLKSPFFAERVYEYTGLTIKQPDKEVSEENGNTNSAGESF
jgi:hypothetical protein